MGDTRRQRWSGPPRSARASSGDWTGPKYFRSCAEHAKSGTGLWPGHRGNSGSGSADCMEEVRFEVPFEGQAGVFICCLYILIFFLQAGMRGRAFQAGNNPMSKGPEVSSCRNSDSSV